MKLTCDFYKDWIALLRGILINSYNYSESDINKITDEEMPFIYFNAELRRPEQRVRTVELANGFNCPDDLVDGWERLKSIIEKGEDITPNLSTLVDIVTQKDQMLNEWGVHHFHLGTEFKKNFIKRTGPLLFALISNDTFYALGIYDHSSWSNLDVVETIHQNWPKAIERYKTNALDIAYAATSDDIKELRKSYLNSFIKTTDGTVYAPIGGGMTSNGHSVNSIMKAHKQRAFLKKIENDILTGENESIVKNILTQNGYTDNEYIQAHLEITSNNYYVAFPEYNNCRVRYIIN